MNQNNNENSSNIDDNTYLDLCKLLIIGAGGLGCELLKNLAMLGFKNIDIIDMDTIEISNLNRQFLFREDHIGKSKAISAAEIISKRFHNINIKGHHDNIENFNKEFYKNFHIVITGLDSIVARRWMNNMLHSLLEYDSDGNIIVSSVIPMIDGSTEGLKGNVRVIIPGTTSCFECNLDLFPNQTSYPVCTITNTPRLPEHCVEYIKMIAWDKDSPFKEPLNIDNSSHIDWIFKKALERANFFGITGVTRSFTLGVLKSIIPAVSTTNSIISGICSIEVIKLITGNYKVLNDFFYLSIDNSIYNHTFKTERRSNCSVCAKISIQLDVSPNNTLQELVTILKKEPNLWLKSPGISTFIEGQQKTLYMPNIPSLEKATSSNLPKPLKDLGLSNNSEIYVTDLASPQPINIKLKFSFNI